MLSPSSPPARLPGSAVSSTPKSGTSSAARISLSRSRLGSKKGLPFSPSAGGLAELSHEVLDEIRFRGEGSGAQGDHRGVGGGAGAVRADQLRSWNKKQCSGDVKKEDLNDRINRVSSGVRGDSKCGGGDFNLNFSQPADQEPYLLDTIDLSTCSPCTTPPPDTEQRVLPRDIGFKNYGNTCYMNAVTQTLLGLNIFVKEIICRLNSQEDGAQGLLQAFSQLCLACTKGETVSANQGMIRMKRQFEMVDKEFEGNKMQDASEFLCRALEKMSEAELLRLTASPQHTVTSQDQNIIENYFLHQKEETLVCQGCKSETKCKQSDLTMWCDTVSLSSRNWTRSMSLRQCLEQSLSEEVVERRCEKCGCDEATTSSRLVKLPRVLVIILKRYRFNEQDQTSSNKVKRQVDIPETVSLTSLTSANAILPSQLPGAALPSTPVKMMHGGARVETPGKFRGLGVAEVESLSEDDQLEYMLYFSKKEADNLLNRSGADEDADLKAALEASMVDDDLNHSDKSLGRAPARKRSFGQLGGGVFTHGDGDSRREKLEKAMEYVQSKEVTTGKENDKAAKKPSPRVRKSPRKKVKYEEVPHPRSKQQEEDDLQEALKLSRQEQDSVLKDIDLQEALKLSRQEQDSVLKDMEFQWSMEDLENNNVEEVAMPEHTYQLQSVVSHHGASARAGHYVADVYRFDACRWMRYDDARVTPTEGVAVRTGTNTANGYILTYLHQGEWEEARRLGSSLGDIQD